MRWTRDWVAVKTLRTKGLTKLVSVALLLLLPGLSQSESKLFMLFDDEGTPRHVQVWGWGRGKGLICQKIAKSGKESIEVTSPEPLSGAVIAGDFNLVIESLPWSRSLLRFWLRLAEGEKGTQFNVHISTDGGDADCYFNIEKDEKENGWVLVRLPFLQFRNFWRASGKVRAIGFKSAGRAGEACQRFFIDAVAIEISEKPIIPSEILPKATVEVDKKELIAGEILHIKVQAHEKCSTLVRVVKEDLSIGRMLLKQEELQGLVEIEWEGLGDEIREPWGALRWDRIDRAFLPDGKYKVIATFIRQMKERVTANDVEIPISLKGFGDKREIFIYHKPPGMWMHASKIKLIGSEKELTLHQGLNPSAFGSLFPQAFLLYAEGVDITEKGIVIGRAAPENIALNSEVKVCAEENPNATWGGWRGLIDGSDAWWVTPQDYPPEKTIWFELTLPKEATVAKVMVKQAHGVEERNRIKRLILRFDDGSEVELDLPKDTACHWFYIEPPRKTRKIYAEAVEFWGKRQGRCGLSEFAVYEAMNFNVGYFVTNDIMPIGATKWVRFVSLHEGRSVRWYYSLDHGESWRPIPKDGNLSNIPLKWGVIRLKCEVGSDALVRGFELTWRYNPKKQISKPLDPRTCAIFVKDGLFYNKGGERVRLFGWFYTPPIVVKGHTHVDIDEWLLQREREIASFACYSINCVRLGVSGALFLPDAENTFPDTPEYAKVMLENGFSPLFPKLLDELINLLARYGIYTILEFHDNPPWGYWSEIPVSGAKTHPHDYPKAFEFARMRIGKLWRWVARHFKGNPFIVGFEVPWNEPVIGHRPWAINTREDSEKFDRIYRELVEECVKAIKSEDPKRICILGPNGWNGVRCDERWIPPSSFWFFPEGVEAFHFHDYPQHIASREGTMCERFAYPRASGVPIVRTEGHCRYFFWNKHDTSFGWGERGIDSMLAQEFAMGIEGTLGWGHGGGERELFGIDFARYHSWCRFWKEVKPKNKATVAIVMASEKRHNSDELPPHPVVEALLCLHVVPFDFLFDDCAHLMKEWIKRYNALILVSDGLPEETLRAVKESGIPVFEFDSNQKIEETLPKLSGFLKRHRVFVDERTPPNLLVAYGDKGIIIYERKGKKGEYTVFLRLPLDGKVKLIDECTDEVLYSGSAEWLWSKGVKVHLKPFRAKIIRIQKG